MKSLAEVVAEIVDLVPAAADAAEHGLAVQVTSLEITFPIEARISAGGALMASPPRGRLATGFDPPHARLRARFDWGSG